MPKNFSEHLGPRDRHFNLQEMAILSFVVHILLVVPHGMHAQNN